jgi:hypothetical protein
MIDVLNLNFIKEEFIRYQVCATLHGVRTYILQYNVTAWVVRVLTGSKQILIILYILVNCLSEIYLYQVNKYETFYNLIPLA